MKYKHHLQAVGLPALLFSCLLLLMPSYSQSLQAEPFGSIERLDPEVDKLLPRDSAMEIVASGFTWCEGPVWRPEQQDLLFSDIPRNSIFRFTPNDGIGLFMSPSGYTGVTYYGLEPGSNGLAIDVNGELLMCEHGDRRVSRLTKDGGKVTIADRYQGKRLNSPNDLVVAKNGTIFFTDPPYGLPDREKDARRELDHFGVYRIDRDSHEAILLTDSLARPNGIGLSPDETSLFVAQSDPTAAIWTRFDLKDGMLSNRTVIADVTDRVKNEPGLPDGMAIDPQGNLWATGPGGVYIMRPDGQLLGRLVTGERTSNCCFAEDGNTLYITADTYLLRIKVSVR